MAFSKSLYFSGPWQAFFFFFFWWEAGQVQIDKSMWFIQDEQTCCFCTSSRVPRSDPSGAPASCQCWGLVSHPQNAVGGEHFPLNLQGAPKHTTLPRPLRGFPTFPALVFSSPMSCHSLDELRKSLLTTLQWMRVIITTFQGIGWGRESSNYSFFKKSILPFAIKMFLLKKQMGE